ncbi:GlxA family transcriptional regulator [Chiayiivirga flava]|uniref:Transcriptional regulator GlxA family with amidase domain n=1 Tax=Chiayiivirga flava TaxID=659595 RepID=A0A7W8G0Z9_9GAMM|nr:helix-turn-helix domain-containing protein [Chiayiivirga flava]MBB5208884.1 transcriptional regulator GlxA family with amidase domain [Chiayiivirga flava]
MTAHAPRAIPVTVVLPPRTLLLDVAGPIEVLRVANRLQHAVRFDIAWVGPAARVTSSIGLVLDGIAPLPAALPDGALVVVSGAVDDVAFASSTADAARDAADEARIVAWLHNSVRAGHTLASICSGALLAARAGLLDGIACTTHHACIDALAALAPAAKVLDNRLYVGENERWSSAGVTSGVDLMLHLVARQAGPACAAAVARHLVVYARRGGSDPQHSHWLDGRNHLHPAVHRVQDAIAQAPARPWTLTALAHVAGASPRHLSRLFNEHAGMGLPDYINRLRVALARELIAQTRLDMDRVAERCGFGSARQLRRAWKRLHDEAPHAARTRN